MYMEQQTFKTIHDTVQVLHFQLIKRGPANRNHYIVKAVAASEMRINGIWWHFGNLSGWREGGGGSSSERERPSLIRIIKPQLGFRRTQKWRRKNLRGYTIVRRRVANARKLWNTELPLSCIYWGWLPRGSKMKTSRWLRQKSGAFKSPFLGKTASTPAYILHTSRKWWHDPYLKLWVFGKSLRTIFQDL